MSASVTGLKKGVFVVLAACLTLVILEVFLQAFYYVTVGDYLFRRTLPAIYAADPVRCYRVASDLDYTHRTNEFKITIHTNSKGFRVDEDHREYALDKSEDTYRILLTGPSFAFGWGSNYEHIFATLIEDGLRVPKGKRVELINLGTPSQGSAEQLCWLEQVGYAYRPDLVLHVSYGRVVTTRATSCPEKLTCPAVVDGQLVRGFSSLGVRAKAFFKRFGTVFYGYYAYNMIVRPDPVPDESKALHNVTASNPESDAGLEEIVQSYVDHADYVRSIVGPDTLVAFLYLPFSYQVHPEDVGRFADIRSEDIPRGRRQIAKTIEMLEARDVKILNTLPALLDEAGDARLYYWLDIHFTEAGNRVVGEAAVPFLERVIAEHEGAAGS